MSISHKRHLIRKVKYGMEKSTGTNTRTQEQGFMDQNKAVIFKKQPKSDTKTT